MIINSTNNHQMMSKGIQKNKESKITLSYSELENLELPVQIENIYFPYWDNEPPKQESLIKWNDTHLLGRGSILCLCAKAGVGKSSVIEAFISSHLNPKADSLGVKINLQKNKNLILICDTERSQWESHKAWSKLMKRASIEHGTDVKDKLIFANLKALDTSKKKIYIDSLLNERNDIGLIVFDGSSDFVNNTNDIDQSNKFIEWINSFNPDISFIFTIHTNPNDDKPRGHLGSELNRKCESSLLASRTDDIFTITTDFSLGKNRHAGHISWNYKYCTMADMFVSTNETTKIKSIKKENKNFELIEKVFKGHKSLYWADIIDGIMKETGRTKSASEKYWNRNLRNIVCVERGQDGWEIARTIKDNIEDNIEDN
jgi:hypothetical protein